MRIFIDANEQEASGHAVGMTASTDIDGGVAPEASLAQRQADKGVGADSDGGTPPAWLVEQLEEASVTGITGSNASTTPDAQDGGGAPPAS